MSCWERIWKFQSMKNHTIKISHSVYRGAIEAEKNISQRDKHIMWKTWIKWYPRRIRMSSACTKKESQEILL